MKDWIFKRTTVAASMVCVLVGSTAEAQRPAPGELDALKKMMQEVLSQNEDLRRRVRELEEAVKRGQAPTGSATGVVGEAPKDPATPLAAEVPTEPVKTARDKIQLGGAIQVEAGTRRDFSRVTSSDLALSAAEFDFEADVVDWAKAELSLQWDSSTNNIVLNEALVTFAKPTLVPVYLRTGQGIVPFGTSIGTTVAARFEESLTITGPLTTEIFEAKEDFVLLGFRKYGFNAGAYLYNGTTDNRKRGKHLDHYGATVSYGMKTDLLSFDVGVDWNGSVFDTDGLTTAFPELQKRPRVSAGQGRSYTPGISTHGRLGMFGFSLLAEYDGAMNRVHFTRNRRDVSTMPEAWQVEFGYMTKIFGIRPYAAINYSATAGMLGAFPQRRLLGSVGSFLTDNIRLALEYANEKDYPRIQSGTGRDSDAWILQLTYEW